MRGSYTLFFLIGSMMVSILDGQTMGGPKHDRVVVCYVSSWAVYRPESGSFGVGNIDPTLCTHLVYAFAGLNATDYTIRSLDPWQDIEKEGGKSGYNGLVGLKKNYPHLTVTIAIGGWNEGSTNYSNMAFTQENRRTFINSVLAFLDTYKFDGLDLDWEYPTRNNGRPEDKANYVALVKELKQAFTPRGYLLTAAFGVGKQVMDSAYNLPELNRYLDLIHVMCYDYHGKWDEVVGANAPLKPMGDDDVFNVEYTVKYMINHGVSRAKLVLGLPLYGRTFLLKDPATKVIEFGVTPTRKDEGFAGPYTREAGFMGYNEICRELNNDSIAWTYHWHEPSKTPYLHDGERVVSYDNQRSIALKVKLAVDYGLKGLMVWSMDTDDFQGSCGSAAKDAYVDFLDRYKQLVDDPVLKKALNTLGLPDMNRPETLGKGISYVVSNGRLELRIPEPEFSNYPLMRTINEATMLAISEKKIRDEMERVIRGNEVEDTKTGPGAASFTGSCYLVVLFGAVTALLRV